MDFAGRKKVRWAAPQNKSNRVVYFIVCRACRRHFTNLPLQQQLLSFVCTMKTLILLIVASVACASMASAAKYSPVPRFMRGRPTGGMLNYGLRDTVASRRTKGEGALPAGVQEMWVTQKIDNFNPQDTSTYQERFFVNGACVCACVCLSNWCLTYHFNVRRPVLEQGDWTYLRDAWRGSCTCVCLVLHVLRGGRHRSRACVVGCAEDPTWAVECDMVHNAQVLQGLVILTEHRFYGKSQPFTDLSTEHLQYLSSEQALADYANLIDHVRELYNATDSNPVVAFGGSYSGALAAWLRLKVGHPAVLLGACGQPPDSVWGLRRSILRTLLAPLLPAPPCLYVPQRRSLACIVPMV